MSTVLQDHGGIIPPEFHTPILADTTNKVILIVNTENSPFNYDSYKTLLLNRVQHIFINIPSLPALHPLISACTMNDTNEVAAFAKMIVSANNVSGAFFYVLSDSQLIHPTFWSILKTAQQNTNYTFYDSEGKSHMLLYVTKDGISSKTVDTCTIAAYSSITPDILRSVEQGITRHIRCQLDEMVIHTTNMYTPLCQLATKYMTDKSPYNLITHRHSYTAIYDTFLTPYRHKTDLKVGEAGVLNGSSIRMWRDYFPHADIHGFDIVESYLNNIKDIPGVTRHLLDAADSSKGLRDVLQKECIGGKKFDILLEDASHRLEHQLLFIRDAIDYIHPGGLLIIEDIFRDIPAARFEEALQLVSHKVAKALLVQPEHLFQASPGWNNDRILFVWVA